MVRRGSWAPLLALAVLAVVLVRLAFDVGGYFPPSYLEAGAICFAGLGVLLLVHLPRHRFSSHALLALGALAALAAWTALSAAWSPQPDEALLDFQRSAVYVGVLGLALMAAGSGRPGARLLWTALAVCVVVVGAGLISRLRPDLITAVPDTTGLTGYRLNHPLTYWNAFGGMAAFGAVLAAGLGADPRAAAPARALATVLSVVLGVAMYLSLSRGSWLALAVGLVALVLLTPYRVSALLTLGVVGAAVGLCVLRLRGLDALVEDPGAGEGQAVEGRTFVPYLAFAALAAGAAQWALARIRSSSDVQAAAEAVRGRVLAGGAIGLAILAIGGYAVAGAAIEGNSAKALDDVSGWVDRQWDDFLLTSTFSQSGRERLTTSRGTRSDIYRVALDGFRDSPLHGDGAGSFEWRWYQAREVQESTREPHSLWLGTLGELGLVGVALLLAFVASVGVGAARGLRRPGALRRGQTAAAAAACGVWVVHSAVDWDWQVPAFTGTVLLAAAALLPAGVRRRRRSRAATA